MKVLHRRARHAAAVQPLTNQRFGCPECGHEVERLRGERGAFCRTCFKLWRVVSCDGCGREGLLAPRAQKYRCHGCGDICAVR